MFDLAGAVAPPPGYRLPTRVKAKVNPAHPEKSTLAASGTLDTGTGVPDFSGAATLTSGVLGPHAVTSPDLAVRGAAAGLKGGGRDALELRLSFATDGVAPPAAEDLTIAFGGTFTSTLGGDWVRKGNGYVRTAKAPGITKATVDYVTRTITIAGSRLDLGAFADGGNAVTLTVTRGSDTRSVAVRMAKAGAKLVY